MLSGRYRTESLASHWASNSPGYCLAPTCSLVTEDLEHILLYRPSYQQSRDNFARLWRATKIPTILHLITTLLSESGSALLLLIPSTNLVVIRMYQDYGPEPLRIVFHLTRTWCFTIHKSRAKLLERWTF